MFTVTMSGGLGRDKPCESGNVMLNESLKCTEVCIKRLSDFSVATSILLRTCSYSLWPLTQEKRSG